MAAGSGPGRAAPAPNTRHAVLLDTGFLVALFDRRESTHESAKAWLGASGESLWTVASVFTEAAHFIPARLRPALARLSADGRVQVHAADAAGHLRMAELFEHYADMSPDWADMELLWLAESTGIRRIATLDAADFGDYRIHGRRAFDIVWPPR